MLSKDEILNVAKLARIELAEDEVEKYRSDLSVVLGYFDELASLNTQDVEPIGHITGMEDVLRQDLQLSADEETLSGILKNAPEVESGQIKVKSVL